jgi:hypothetical protein
MATNEFRKMALEIPKSVESSQHESSRFPCHRKDFARHLVSPTKTGAWQSLHQSSSAPLSRRRLGFSSLLAAPGAGKVTRMFIFRPRKRALCARLSTLRLGTSLPIHVGTRTADRARVICAFDFRQSYTAATARFGKTRSRKLAETGPGRCCRFETAE